MPCAFPFNTAPDWHFHNILMNKKGKNCRQDDSLVWGLSWTCLHVSAEIHTILSSLAAAGQLGCLQLGVGSRARVCRLFLRGLCFLYQNVSFLCFHCEDPLFKMNKYYRLLGDCCLPKICTFQGLWVLRCRLAPLTAWANQDNLILPI